MGEDGEHGFPLPPSAPATQVFLELQSRSLPSREQLCKFANPLAMISQTKPDDDEDDNVTMTVCIYRVNVMFNCKFSSSHIDRLL